MDLLVKKKPIAEQKLGKSEGDGVWVGVMATLKQPFLILRRSGIGTIIGAIPGVGGTVAGFISYMHAKQTCRNNENKSGHDNHESLEGLREDAANLAAEHRVGDKDGEDHHTDNNLVPIEEILEQLGASLDLRRQVHRTTDEQHDRQHQLDAPVAVKTEI